MIRRTFWVLVTGALTMSVATHPGLIAMEMSPSLACSSCITLVRKLDAALEDPLCDTLSNKAAPPPESRTDSLSSRGHAVIIPDRTNKRGDNGESWTRTLEEQLMRRLKKYNRTEGIHVVVIRELVDGRFSQQTVIISDSCPL